MSAHAHLNGTLFEGSIKGGTPQLFPSRELLSDKARFPRGFTPQRLREVQTATRMDPQKTYPPRAADTAAVRDTVARSTVPTEHLKNVSWYPGSSVSARAGSLGQYTPPGRVAGGAQIHISPGPGPSRGGTPVHELGHHVSHLQGTAHSEYDTTENMGREEAYAENYAETHFRDRRGRAPQVIRRTPHDWTHDDQRGGPYGGFHEGWREQREAGSPLVATERTARIAETERQLNGHPLQPPDHVPGQIPLLAGVGEEKDKWSGQKTFDWDYTFEDRQGGLKRDTPPKPDLAWEEHFGRKLPR